MTYLEWWTKRFDEEPWLMLHDAAFDLVHSSGHDADVTAGLQWMADNQKYPVKDAGGIWRFLYAPMDKYTECGSASAVLPQPAWDLIAKPANELESIPHQKASVAVLAAARAIGQWLREGGKTS